MAEPGVPTRWSIHTSHHAILLLPLAIYVVLVVIVAILPAIALAKRYPADPAGKIGGNSELIARGEKVFTSLGCNVCHTQQIRGDERYFVQLGDKLVHPVLPPDARYGLDGPSEPRDYADSHPPLLGTQRTGPDLIGIGDRIPSVTWHYWHLYNPRSVSPGSVMPSYRELFRVVLDKNAPTCEPDQPPSVALGIAIILGLALLFGLVGWALFGFTSSTVMALLLGIGAGWLVFDECRICRFQPADCEVIEDGVDALGLPPDARLVATPDAKAVAEYLLSLKRPVRKP